MDSDSATNLPRQKHHNIKFRKNQTSVNNFASSFTAKTTTSKLQATQMNKCTRWNLLAFSFLLKTRLGGGLQVDIIVMLVLCSSYFGWDVRQWPRPLRNKSSKTQLPLKALHYRIMCTRLTRILLLIVAFIISILNDTEVFYGWIVGLTVQSLSIFIAQFTYVWQKQVSLTTVTDFLKLLIILFMIRKQVINVGSRGIRDNRREIR